MELAGYKQSETKSTKFSINQLFESIDSIRGTVVLNYNWASPKEVERLELQDRDYRGLFFLYNEALKEIARVNKEKK